jgi:EF hand
MFKGRQGAHHCIMCQRIIRALSLVTLILTLSPTSSQAQAQSNEAGTEIITGHARNSTPDRTAKPRRNQDARRGGSSSFLQPLAPLPQTPRLGNIKRPRKHKLDQDRDGFVSKSELELANQSRSAAFREADRNNDGKLDATEMRYFQALIQPTGRRRR